MKLNGGLCTGASLHGFNGDWKKDVAKSNAQIKKNKTKSLYEELIEEGYTPDQAADLVYLNEK
jgi:hypothetical protein|tara:strand:+ start:391 stop:579 length:189 start_codon:yes stop_codon:yes gene_type:complete